MFRTKFASLFEDTTTFGPQDIEDGITSEEPSEIVVALMVRLISLALNRKRHVEVGQHKRAFQEVIHLNWRLHPAKSWMNERGEIVNPFYGERSFSEVDWEQKLVFLRLLIDWALINSEAVRRLVDEEYSGPRLTNDRNVRISVQPLGEDREKRKYWMIKGDGDTRFRTYREQMAVDGNINFCSVAGDAQELSELISNQFHNTSTRPTKQLRDKLESMLPNLRENEESRRAREYQRARKIELAARVPIQPTVTTRTRGRRINYATMDEEGNESENDKRKLRASTRSQGAPVPKHPTRSLHGRRLRAPRHGEYGEALHSNFSNSDDELQQSKRPRIELYDNDVLESTSNADFDDFPNEDERISASFGQSREGHDELKDNFHEQTPIENAYHYYQVTVPCSSLAEYLNSSASSNLKSAEIKNILLPDERIDLPQPQIPFDFLGSGSLKNVLLCVESLAAQAQSIYYDNIAARLQNHETSNLANGGHHQIHSSNPADFTTPISMKPVSEAPAWLPPQTSFAV